MSTANDVRTLLDHLDGLETKELGALLASVPAIASRVLPPYFDAETPAYDWLAMFGITSTATTQDLALFFTTDGGLQLARDGLDRLQQNLLTLAVWHEGKLDVTTAEFETGVGAAALRAATAGILDTIFNTLSGVAKDKKTLLQLRPAIVESLNFGASSARHGLDYATKADLNKMLKRFGARTTSTDTRDSLLEQVIAFLTDPSFLQRYVQTLSKKAQGYLQDTNDGARHQLWEVGHTDYSRWAAISGPTAELIDSGLYCFDRETETLWMWLEASVAINGRLTQPIDITARDPKPVALHEKSARVPDTDSNMRKLLDLWSHKPPPPLSDGSIGVKPIRDAAKQLKLPTEIVGTLACLAVDAGFMEIVVTGHTGSGRKRKANVAWQMTTKVGSWSTASAFDRWSELARVWALGSYAREAGGLPERVDNGLPKSAVAQSLRRSLWTKLASTQPGFGFRANDLVEWMTFTHPSSISADSAAALLTSLGILGIVEAGDPVGLSTFGRAIAVGDHPHIEAGATNFLIQGDQTIVTPPDLDADVTIELERYANRESASGALIYRLSDSLIAKQLAAGVDAETVLGFLRKHSSTELPQNIEYTITDAERRARTMKTGAAATYIVCTDAGLMTRLLTVKPAKLQSIAPTVAVSDLSLDKVETELAKKNVYLPVAPSSTTNSVGPTAEHILNTAPLLTDVAALANEASKIRKRKPRDAKSFAAQINRLSRF